MTRGATRPRWCREVECDVRVIFARRDLTDRWVALEARDRRPASTDAVGSLVVVDRRAWQPEALAEHFMTRFEISREKARELVADYPHHRPHHHEEAND